MSRTMVIGSLLTATLENDNLEKQNRNQQNYPKSKINLRYISKEFQQILGHEYYMSTQSSLTNVIKDYSWLRMLKQANTTTLIDLGILIKDNDRFLHYLYTVFQYVIQNFLCLS